MLDVSARTRGILFTVGVMMTYAGLRNVDLRFHADRVALHEHIIAGAAESPYRYRVLVPFVAEALRRPARWVLGGDTTSFITTYVVIDFVSFLLVIGCLFVLLREWFSEEQAYVGVLLAALSVMVALQDHAFQPWSYLEPALFTMALLATQGRRYKTLAMLTILATLNRETGLLLPLAGFAVVLRRDGFRAATVRTGPSLLAWAVVFLGLRVLLGNAPVARPVSEILAINVRPGQLALASLAWFSILGILWVWSVRGLRRAPDLIRAASAVIPIQLVLIAIWGIWLEVRLLLVLLPVLIPLAMSYVFPIREQLEPSSART